MANQFSFPSFPNENSVRAFPLTENSSRLDLGGNVKIPDVLLVAATINALPEYVAGTFYVSRISSLPDGANITLSFAPVTGAPRIICQVQVTSALHEENKSYAWTGSGIDSSVVGTLTIGDIAQVQSELIGSFDFDAISAPFESSCIFVSVPAVRYLEVFSGNASLGLFTGAIRLRSGRNIRLRYVVPEGATVADGSIIAIDAIDGLNLTPPSGCEQLPQLGPPIRTINQIPPDESGNFTLDGSDCIEISSKDNGLTIKDLCAASCCGCEELAALLEGQVQVEAQIQLLRDQIQAVQTNQAAMIVNLVSSLPS